MPNVRACKAMFVCVVFLLQFSYIIEAEDFSAPVLPYTRIELPLLIREDVPITESSSSMRIVRYGHAGKQEAANTLDIPESGYAVNMLAYDWLMAGDSVVEVRAIADYDLWLIVSPNTHLVFSAVGRTSLMHGNVTWQSEDANIGALSMSDTLLQGSGSAHINRTLFTVDVHVSSGKFEVYQKNILIEVLRAGEKKQITLNSNMLIPVMEGLPTLRKGEVKNVHVHFDKALEKIITNMLFSRQNTHDHLSELWSSLHMIMPLYGHIYEYYLPLMDAPDVSERRIGEALRILSAHRFIPQ